MLNPNPSDGVHIDPSVLPEKGGAPLPTPLSPLEMKILRECQVESYWYRSLPISAFLGAGALVGVRTGYLRPGANYGAAPKVIMASIIGYFVGKFSYANACADKFLSQAPDCSISDGIRLRRGLPAREHSDSEPIPTYQGSEHEPSTGYQGIVTREENVTSDTPQVTPGTYEALRKRNREQYEAGIVGRPVINNTLPSGAHTHAPAPAVPPYKDEDLVPSKLPKARSNKYGDEGFE